MKFMAQTLAVRERIIFKRRFLKEQSYNNLPNLWQDQAIKVAPGVIVQGESVYKWT
jgi:hypothetical protein